MLLRLRTRDPALPARKPVDEQARAARCREARVWRGELGDADEMADWFDDGYDIPNELRATMHGEIDPRTVEEARIRHWQKYGWGIEATAVSLGRPGVTEWLRENPDARLHVAREEQGEPGT
jgi:hypothetical protein